MALLLLLIKVVGRTFSQGVYMKSVLTIAILAFSCQSFAWISKGLPNKEYTFKYNLSGQTLEIKKAAASYEDAFDQAAQQCFNHYKGHGQIDEDKGLDIIDTCANPRS